MIRSTQKSTVSPQAQVVPYEIEVAMEKVDAELHDGATRCEPDGKPQEGLEMLGGLSRSKPVRRTQRRSDGLLGPSSPATPDHRDDAAV